MKLQWTFEARADRLNIFEYIEADSPIAALKLDTLFQKAVDRLLVHPNIGRLGRVSGTREFVVSRNFIVVYDLTGDAVRIIRILHAAMQWPPHPEN
ncbi:type II toxin-antitoxin system RelE/ParE family toxin [Neorhizobium sp. P12A]|nr:type II toxin-antitoxin system RelE/ParE family toxin [Neorhizobium sp. P12A]